MPRTSLSDLIGIEVPILQAPMAGVSTPELAAAVTRAGGLGALGLGAATPQAARDELARFTSFCNGPLNANVFCHQPPVRDAQREAGWIERAAPLFEAVGAVPPATLENIYPSFVASDDMLDVLLEARPAVVSFHFGLPTPEQLKVLKAAGIVLIGNATSLDEARQIEAAGLDAVIAQGWSAGGHRGVFDENGPDERLSTLDLVRLLVAEQGMPVIAAGGIMDGRDAAVMLAVGAEAVQLGTAFVGCPETSADAAYRARLARGGETQMTRVISGRHARCLTNDFTAWGQGVADTEVAAYPVAYDLGKAMNAAAKAVGRTGYGAQWAGSEVSRARIMPAADLMALLKSELV